MDLFVINRYKDADEEKIVDQEAKHLQKLKQKIEERKKLNKSHKNIEEITLTQSNKQVKPLEKSEVSITADIVNPDGVPSTVEDKLKEKENHKVEKEKVSEFKVLGANEFQKKPTVKRVLPYWLSHSINLSTNLQNLSSNIDGLDYLHATLKMTLISEGVTHLFPVQEKVIPFIIEQHKMPFPFWPHDICVSAPTGSGKTLSFVLPITQVLMQQVGRHVRALIVLPVQELATQVAKVFKKYAVKGGLKVALLSSSTPIHHEQKQIVRYSETQGWISEVDVIVCTAGRLVEHIQNTEGFSLKHLKFLVIDEADRIMDHIQNDWLYHLDRHIKLENELMTGRVPSASWNILTEQKTPPHKLLFSATLSQDPEKLEQWALYQPKLFSVSPKSEYEDDEHIKSYTTPDELNEQFVICDAEGKPLVLYHLLVERNWNRVLCFTNSAQSGHRLMILLNTWSEGKIRVAELSSALDKQKRESVLKKFHQAEIDILIGTDALARGIDIPHCDYVISYDPPRNIKTYIHRVGRTGRAGRNGNAVTMLQQNQVNLFKEMLQRGKDSALPVISLPDDIFERLSSSYEIAINATKNVINEEIKLKVDKSKALKRGPKLKTRKRKFSQTSQQ